MTPVKRLFDIVLAVALSVILIPFFILTAIIVAVLDGRPVLYISERMKTPTQSFPLVKFRTMKVVDTDSGVSGGDKKDRITRSGAFLRRTRLDEVPQLWNILLGHISFVGPRPPLKQYVENFPEIYSQVLQSRPGVTGLASVYFHKCEERLLRNTSSVEETDRVYRKICIPRKATIDLIYQRRRNICFDIRIMLITVFKFLK